MLSKKFIVTAFGEVGYLEKASNAFLEDKTRNAGSANYTKYGKWYGINPGAWCAMFVSWCAEQAGASDIIPRHASCTAGIAAFKRLGKWHDRRGYEPKPGDIIYFGTASGTPQHVGIVWAVADGRVYTVEGNTGAGEDIVIANGGAVAEKNYSLTNSRIIGYGNPAWPEDKEDNMQRYDKIADMPAWAQADIKWMIDHSMISGSGGPLDNDGRPADLDLSLDMIRTLIICKRMREAR